MINEQALKYKDFNLKRRSTLMDTSTLMVGQVVHMESGVYGNKGKVSKITPSGIEVQPYDYKTQTYSEWPRHFNNTGWGRKKEGMYESGPWQIVERVKD